MKNERERNIDVNNIDQLPLISTFPGGRTCHLSVYQMMHNQLSHTGQVYYACLVFVFVKRKEISIF